jgi:ribosome-associated protein
LAKKKTGDTEALKDLVIEAILEKKGQDVVSLDLRDIHDTVSDYFIIAHGDSGTQVNAIFQSILEATKPKGHLPYHSEGMKNGEWVIIDFVDVVAHIFYREKRDFYMLEELWNDAKVTKHTPAAAIKPKPVRQSNRKHAPMSEDTLEDIERSLPKSERTLAKREFTSRPFAKRNPEKKAGDKKFIDKKIQERKSAAKKAPARKGSEAKAPVAGKKPAASTGKKPAASKRTSTKKK